MARTQYKQPDFEKRRKRGFAKPKSLFGSHPKEGKYEFAPLPELPSADTRSDKEKQVARTLKDERLAKAILKLQQKYTNGTLPELVTLHYLVKWNVPHWYQVALFGGHVRGGVIPDFVVNRGGRGLAIQVQGNYWHEGFEAEQKDRLAKMQLIGQVVNGTQIEQVVEVWENKLYDDPEEVLNMALMGIELGE